MFLTIPLIIAILIAALGIILLLEPESLSKNSI
jgi:hypothetical protein